MISLTIKMAAEVNTFHFQVEVLRAKRNSLPPFPHPNNVEACFEMEPRINWGSK